MPSCEFAGIGWVITIIAVFISHRLTKQRDDLKENRKEIRAEVDKLLESVNLLRNAANDYYFPAKNDANSKRLCVDIHNHINECDRLVAWLNKPENKIDLTNDFYDLYDTITGGDFESIQHRPGEQHTEKCKEISIKIQSIIAKTEHWYRNQYHEQ